MAHRDTITLTRRMREMLACIPADWTLMAPSPNDRNVKALEARGLIEVRLDPEADRRDCMLRAQLGWQMPWQWRRKA